MKYARPDRNFRHPLQVRTTGFTAEYPTTEQSCTQGQWCFRVLSATDVRLAADSSLHNFARSFGSAIKLRGNVTAALERVSFAYNVIIAEPNRGQRYAPDLYVGDRSTALLRSITMSEVTPAADLTPAAAPVPGTEAVEYRNLAPAGGVSIARLNDRATVLANPESGVIVYDVDTGTNAKAEVEIGTAPASVLTMDDAWYINIMAVRPPALRCHKSVHVMHGGLC